MTYHRDRPEQPMPACAKLDPRTADELFFAHHHSHEARAARNICGTCPLLVQCRQYADKHEALPYPDGHAIIGVWGGETTDERRARRRNQGDVDHRCKGCNRPIWRSHKPIPVDHVKHKRHGLCVRCAKPARGTALERAATIAEEDARWDLEQLRVAKGRYKAGDRDAWTLEGRRVYERWNKREVRTAGRGIAV